MGGFVREVVGHMMDDKDDDRVINRIVECIIVTIITVKTIVTMLLSSLSCADDNVGERGGGQGDIKDIR